MEHIRKNLNCTVPRCARSSGHQERVEIDFPFDILKYFSITLRELLDEAAKGH